MKFLRYTPYLIAILLVLIIPVFIYYKTDGWGWCLFAAVLICAGNYDFEKESD